ncbi:MAG TPA: hypothetical protein VKB95_09200 [Chitinophagaceae bacterium]|nr:hypothetical protein [Chitinophagaceae bacterium]
MNRRISELKEVNSIIQDPNADSVAKAYALELRAKIANRKIVTDYLRFRKTSSTSKIAQTSNPPATAKANDSIRGDFLFYIMSSGLFMLMGIAITGTVLFSRKSNDSIAERLEMGLGILFMFSIFSYVLTGLLELIPRIGKNWNYNYYVAFFIQFLLLRIIFQGLLIPKIERMKEKERIIAANSESPSGHA